MISQPANKHRTIYLKDYRPPDYRVETVNIQFVLDEKKTVVHCIMSVVRNQDGSQPVRPLVLDGKEIALKTVRIDGRRLDPKEYTVTDESLSIPSVPDRFVLEIENELDPSRNTSLTGLYISNKNFFTQCEAEGFRKITYFPDRPDVMSRFFTTIIGDKKKYPVLLSNGNLVGAGDLGNGMHFAKWHDPFPKPAYLFALVAGDLALIQDSFTTMSGRPVSLRIYVQHHNKDKCDHAMDSLKKAMKWDESIYGREYDLDVFMIVAVDDFNMGAMENKGLNIFNSKYVLAKPSTATDFDFQAIMGVVAHEYFHNWSGDRITCRDWFQLSLKEGFTVFRDQQFMEDMTSHGVKRISDVNILRTHQFKEDAGPMAHPVRPESYVEINNFYTMTVYNKGAEVIRMLRTIFGREGFRKGTDFYFSRYDGQAVTTDDFVKALEDANNTDLSQFKLWYSQAGTPELEVSRRYDPDAKTYTLDIKQTCPPTPGQPEKMPFHIPVAVGLLDASGRDLVLKPDADTEGWGDGDGDRDRETGRQGDGRTTILQITKKEETFVFHDIAREPVPSFLRNFSAPVKVKLDLTTEELLFLMANDSDEFNRWDAGQQLAVKFIMQIVHDVQEKNPLSLNVSFIQAFKKILETDMPDNAFKAFALTLPSELYLADFMQIVDPAAIHEARRFALKTLALELKGLFWEHYRANLDQGAYSLDQKAIAGRSLKNLCLSYLVEVNDAEIRRLCLDQFLYGGNMTNVMAAIANIANTDFPEREDVLAFFYHRWKNDPLVVDKWLTIQATSRLPNTLERVRALTYHPAFNIKNPNKVRALIGAFAQGNPLHFHNESGLGYRFLADHVLKIDPLNSQIAARLVAAFTSWKRYDKKRQELIKKQLRRILDAKKISKDVYEIVSKSLA